MSIKIENTQIFGWEGAIRGARNPMDSWDKSDSRFFERNLENGDSAENHYHDILKNHIIVPVEEDELEEGTCDVIGPADHILLMNLCKGGTEEAKWRRMIHVQMDITAPLYWWKEFETYKVGTTSNSCSTMHKIHSKEFTLDDFSCEHLFRKPEEIPDFKLMNDADHDWEDMEIEWHDSNGAYFVEPEWDDCDVWIESRYAIDALNETIKALNDYREKYIEAKEPELNICGTIFTRGNRKKYWLQMIQLLPTSYNQRRTIDLNYEVLASQYRQRKEHKLDEWREYCEWIKTLPYSEFITMEE